MELNLGSQANNILQCGVFLFRVIPSSQETCECFLYFIKLCLSLRAVKYCYAQIKKITLVTCLSLFFFFLKQKNKNIVLNQEYLST